MLTYATFTESNITIFTFLTAESSIYHYFHFYYIKIIFYLSFATFISDMVKQRTVIWKQWKKPKTKEEESDENGNPEILCTHGGK